MTKDDVKERFEELLREHPPLTRIEELFNKALSSGSMDYESDLEQNYRLAKIIYHAILCTMADQWQPVTRVNKEASRNLQNLFQQFKT